MGSVFNPKNFKKIVPYIKNQAVNLHTIKGKLPQRLKINLVVLLVLLVGTSYGQQLTSVNETDTLPYLRSFTSGIKLLNPLEKNFYTKNLGFFCQQELLLQKKTTLPIYLRLGTLEYVNKFEKPSLFIPLPKRWKPVDN